MKVNLKVGLQYTIRGISGEVDAALRRRAAQQKISLNQLIVNDLTRSTIGRGKKADFSDLVGQWADDPDFDDVMKSQRRIDRDKWK